MQWNIKCTQSLTLTLSLALGTPESSGSTALYHGGLYGWCNGDPIRLGNQHVLWIAPDQSHVLPNFNDFKSLFRRSPFELQVVQHAANGNIFDHYLIP